MSWLLIMLFCAELSLPALAEEASASMEPVLLTGALIKTEQLPIDLKTVLSLVEQQNLLLQKEQWANKGELARYRQSQVSILPDIKPSYAQNRFQGGVQIFGGQTLTIFRTTIQPQLLGSWTVYPGGTTVFQILASKRRAQAATFKVGETEQTQLARAAEAYYDFVKANYQKDIADKAVEEAQNQVKLNQGRFEVGIGTKLDLMKSQTVLAQQMQALIDATSQIAKTEQALLNRLNLDPSVRLHSEQSLVSEVALMPASVSVERLLAYAVHHHPQIQRSEKELSALGLDYKSSWSKYIPSVQLQTYINGTGPHFDELALTRYGGFSVSVNFLDHLGLSLPFELREKKAVIQEKLLENQSLVRDLEQSVITAHLDVHRARQSVMVAKLGLTSAQEAYRLAVGRYKEGLAINLDVLDSEVALSRARGTLLDAMVSFNQAEIRLLEAVGLASQKHLIQGVPESLFAEAR